MTNFPSIWGKTHLLNENDEINDSAAAALTKHTIFYEFLCINIY